MSAVVEKIKYFMGMDDEYVYEEEDSMGDFAKPRMDTKPARETENNVRYLNKEMSNMRVTVHLPEEFNCVEKMASCLKSQESIAVNLENLDSETSVRVLDFLQGVTYALDGYVEKVSEQVFIFAPKTVSLSMASKSTKHSGTMPWNK